MALLFDNVWPLVLQGLKARECLKNVFEVLRSYFDKKRVSISISDTKWATRECPQDSMLGPICWNLMFDELLKMIEVQIEILKIAL